MSFLELRHVTKSYQIGKRTYPVLKDINLKLELGEFVTIQGESGGGKTTLINIISGLDRHFGGDVLVAGQPLDHYHERQLDQYRRATIGYISQSYNLIDHLTVLENVLLALDMTRLHRGARLQRAQDLLAQVGLTAHLHQYPNQLSGGQKQRVAIARALAGNPQLLVADEPTGALDADNTADVMRLLQAIAKRGRLVICVTHSQRVAHAGTRIAHLVDGRLCAETVLQPAHQPAADASTQLTSRTLPWHVSALTAFKHMCYTWRWNTLIVLGTAIGLFAVMLFSALGNGLKGYINDQIDTIVDPQSITVMRYTTNAKQQAEQSVAQVDPAVTGAIADHLPTFSAAQLRTLRELPNVVRVEPGISTSDATIKIGRTSYSAPELTTWTGIDSKASVKAGHPAGNNELLLDKRTIAQKWSPSNWRQLVGRRVTVSYRVLTPANQLATVTRRLTVAGIVDSPSGIALNAVNYQTIRSMNRAGGASTQPTFVAVRVNGQAQNETVVNLINHIRQGGKKQFAARSIAATLVTVNTYVDLATVILAAIAGISLLVSIIMIIVTMYMSVSARMREIGILRSLGESRRDIRRLFTSEAVLLGLFSATLATGFAYAASFWLDRVLQRIAGYQFIQLQWQSVALIFGLALVIVWLAALLPARRAARLNPIEALAA
ncbi:ABC transporter ATP-binding protein/permease [Lactiplantibacillus modestisalitolerans]|uniref:ATP-binding cassette domain-containing protein n=1 Tax=Lactiplantibacillus modestisalitolerans TaxID=1457219 RepID=A0ABV5WRF0_9LACO|nr:ABC transporter ATP-binding protein/permease [Lactiplantibacillus modestisalitolerans]